MSLNSPTLTDKQRELIGQLDVTSIGATLHVNELPSQIPTDSIAVLDVEHDEVGGFVCVGFLFYPSNMVYCISDINLLGRLDASKWKIVGHNVKGDCELLRIWGLNISDEQIYWDTQLIHHIIDSSLPEYGLKYLAKNYCAISYPSYDDIVGKRTKKQKAERVTLDKQPFELVAKYNAWDVLATTKLYEYQKTKVREEARSYFETLERPCAFIFSQMESRGIRVDLSYLGQIKEQLESKKAPLEESIKNQLGTINLDSPKQLLEALKRKGITPIWRGKESTDKRALENVKGYSIIQLLLNYREVETLLSSFVYPYLERNTEYIHPFFNQNGTRTGRLSCSNPNLLQIPKRTDNGKLVRRMFIARDGRKLGDCDFGQIEPRVLAHLSKDPNMLQMFNDGIDFHEFTSSKLGISRERAKVLNLSVGYRATWKSVMQQLKCGQQEAQNEIDKWWSLFPTLRRYQDRLIYESRHAGFCTTLLGRRIKIDGLESSNQWKREAAERQIINNITQGTAAEIMKKAMLNISKMTYLSEGFGLLIQVYDELLFESFDIDRDIEHVIYGMESAVNLEVPLIVDAKIGFNWGDVE